jgi:hypothetical protein
MGGEGSAHSFETISHFCARLSRIPLQPGFQYNHTHSLDPHTAVGANLELTPRNFTVSTPHERRFPGCLGFFLNKSVSGLQLSASSRSGTGFDLLPLHFAATVPISDDLRQTFTVKSSVGSELAFSWEVASRIANIRGRIGPSLSWGFAIGFPLNSFFSGGFSLEEPPAGSPLICQLALLSDYRILQGSIAYRRAIGVPAHSLLLGANLWLDRGIGLNLSHEWTEGGEPAGHVTALGLEMGYRNYTVQCAIASDGQVTSAISRKILPNTQLTVGAVATMRPLTCSVSVRLDIASHR